MIGAETLSRIMDWSDRSTCVLFGDGAGAAVLEADEAEEHAGILSTVLFKDVAQRLNIANTQGLDALATYLFDNVGNLTSA